MAKYLMLKHYRGAPDSVNNVPMDQWKPEEVTAHIQFMNDFAAKLEKTGEFVDSQALAPEGTFVRYGGDGCPPVTDGPFVRSEERRVGKQSKPRLSNTGGKIEKRQETRGQKCNDWSYRS